MNIHDIERRIAERIEKAKHHMERSTTDGAKRSWHAVIDELRCLAGWIDRQVDSEAIRLTEERR